MIERSSHRITLVLLALLLVITSTAMYFAILVDMKVVQMVRAEGILVVGVLANLLSLWAYNRSQKILVDGKLSSLINAAYQIAFIVAFAVSLLFITATFFWPYSLLDL